MGEKETTYSSVLDSPLNGIPERKPGPLFPYRPTGEEKEIHQERMNFSSEMGRMVESMVFPIWIGEIKACETEKKELLRCLEPILFSARSYYLQPHLKHADLVEFHKELFGSKGLSWEGWVPKEVPLNPDADKVIQFIDSVCNTELQKTRQDLITTYGAKETIRYFGECVLILAKEIINPHMADEKSTIIPNISIDNDIHLAQFDGISLNLDKNSDFSFWETFTPKGPHVPWQIIETKIPFRARYLTNPKAFSKPSKWDVAQFQNRMSRLVLEGAKNGAKNFNFPTGVRFIYLRGVLGNIEANLKLDSHFFESLSLGISLKLEKAKRSHEPPLEEENEVANFLAGVYKKESRKLAKEERKSRTILVRSDHRRRFWKNKNLSQGEFLPTVDPRKKRKKERTIS